PPHRRKARREQQGVLLAQRHVERRGEPQDHVAAGRRAAQFEKAEMPLRDVGAEREVELGEAAALAPTAEPGREVLLVRHCTCQVVAASTIDGKIAQPLWPGQEAALGEWVGVLIAIVSSSVGGTAAAVTRYLVGNADPLSLAILRWGIGFC